MAPAARNKFGAPNFEPNVLLGEHLLYWRKHLRHCWDISATPSDLAPGALCPLATPLSLTLPTNTELVEREHSAIKTGRLQVKTFAYVGGKIYQITVDSKVRRLRKTMLRFQAKALNFRYPPVSTKRKRILLGGTNSAWSLSKLAVQLQVWCKKEFKSYWGCAADIERLFVTNHKSLNLCSSRYASSELLYFNKKSPRINSVS